MAREEQQTASFNARPHILVVDDDARILDLLSRFLMDKGFVVLSATNTDDAMKILSDSSVDLLVLDIMMPGKTGLELAQELDSDARPPIIFLTALSEGENRIKGYEVGADDYISKPFEPYELLLRIQALLKRTMKQVQEDQIVKLGALTFNVGQGALVDEGASPVSLTDAERELLRALAQHNGEILSRDRLAEIMQVASPRAIDVQITRLRRKIEPDDTGVRLLQTVRGQGYVLRGQMVSE